MLKLYGFRISVNGNSLITSINTKINEVKSAFFIKEKSILKNVLIFPKPSRFEDSESDLLSFKVFYSIELNATAINLNTYA